MIRRNIYLILLILCLGSAGCKKSEPAPLPSSVQAVSNSEHKTTEIRPVSEIVARVHWIGKRQLMADTNSHDLIVIWNVPAGLELEAQTLDKLSTAPWRLFSHQTNRPATGPDKLLRPILDDVLQEESYFEVGYVTNQPGEFAFAIKLTPERGRLWQTNLAAVLESLTGFHPEQTKPPIPNEESNGWTLQTPGRVIELSRLDDWVILTMSNGYGSNLRSHELKNRIATAYTPYDRIDTNLWLTADADLRKAVHAFAPGLRLPSISMLPKIALTVTGNGEFVKTKAKLDFPAPLSLNLEPWNIPTNLIHGDLNAFTAIRGIKPLLLSSRTWGDLKLGETPNQICFWGLPGLPARTFFSVPMEDASNRVSQIADLVMRKGGPFFATNEIGGFRRSTQFEGLEWQGIPYLYPFLRPEKINDQEFVFGGTVLAKNDETPPVLAALGNLWSRTNQIYYDREFTGGQIEQWIYAGQFIRYTSGRAQLPQSGKGLLWLKAIEPITGSSATDITQTGPANVVFTRTSGCGFTGIELNLLIDWLESANFPIGINTLSK